ncbi:MAG: peptidylprolyl isomerase [Bdellovibrionales bacterium RIFOXYD12_FULL_39_22]|nr:MAG: peptidylprolyl isomerase [Bdellovibrionales bacterium RIFOXYB1_FULL_39_21]OFZ41934.1 MAG: peptidylprolyl isomerase [Bdellovibrionales bacterium RIFOXYC12_FULL_39_17]OFZ50650.1 MAG: peptidylprolyl isomerase [Bdellovibrionales bacterium RIFOXYC1_FULL_39_130]OFZ71894.1 MAG: peptidylprolyl isomerase [Bdellovibrionales bacterium RIFOXYC2_FULL_39_8]OFZ77873.1 MAG: peptidylprolyl isomerase [Bdellovibrionales bacterium RIFOXYD1_FULL_39_84]OFZ93691.1 MAG: peptidylprolyl isomerase [Bdellovibrion
MKATKDNVVTIEYTLTNEHGETLDSSKDNGPLAYLHGHSNIISGLEQEIEGKGIGEKLKVTIAPKDGYGEIRQDMIQDVPRAQFEDADNLQVGMQFQVQAGEETLIVMVKSVSDDMVTLDGNHPLAGQTLHFDVEICEIRTATEDELHHGHIHSSSCQHH